jgi:hypothetical protein
LYRLNTQSIQPFVSNYSFLFSKNKKETTERIEPYRPYGLQIHFEKRRQKIAANLQDLTRLLTPMLTPQNRGLVNAFSRISKNPLPITCPFLLFSLILINK